MRQAGRGDYHEYSQAVSVATADRARGPAQETSDEALVLSIATGDKQALQVLFGRHNVRVFRFVLRFLNDEAAAEDLVSEVFLDVWRQANRFEARSQVSTWLLAMARNKALSALRRRSTEELDEEVAEFIEDPADNPGSHDAEEAAEFHSRRLPDAIVGGASRDHRPGLLPREVDRRSSRDHRRSAEYGEDAHVLRAQADCRTDERQGVGPGVRLKDLSFPANAESDEVPPNRGALSCYAKPVGGTSGRVGLPPERFGKGGRAHSLSQQGRVPAPRELKKSGAKVVR